MAEPGRHENRPYRGPTYQPLMIVLAAVSVGILGDTFCRMPLSAWWTGAVVAWGTWLVLWKSKRDTPAGILLWITVAACGGAWHHCQWNLFGEDELGRFARREPQPVCAEAIVLMSPRRIPAMPSNPMRAIPLGDRTRLEVEMVRLRNGATWRPASGRARVSVNGHLLAVHVGDRLRILGDLSVASPACNPGAMDYAGYLRSSRINAFLQVPYPDSITVLERPRLGSLARWIDDLRGAGHELLWQHLGDQQVPLAAALLLGIREELAGDRSDIFLETGTVHLLSVSGLHVGIVAAALLFVIRLLWIPRQLGAILVAGGIALYVAITGAEPPAVRAEILVLMFCAGHVLARRPLPFNSLAAAALVVLVLNPNDLFNIGAQLSFLSVVGLLWCAPRWSADRRPQDPLDRLIQANRSWPSRALRGLLRESRNIVVLSAGVWLLTLPLVMARFHVVALSAIVLNVLIWLPASVGLTAGFALLATGWICWPLAAILGWCCDRSLWILEAMIGMVRCIPASCLWVSGPDPWWLAGFYGGLGLMAAMPALRPSPRRLLLMLALWSAIGLDVSTFGRNRHALECTVLSVGHGCAVVIQLPSGQNLLYDAGKLASPKSAVQSISASLWAQGITRLDAIILSHADADHYNAVPDLIRRFSVDTVCVSEVMFREESRSLAALRDALQSANIPIRAIHAGDCLARGANCRIEVLHPPRHGVSAGDNANSLVLGLEAYGRRILLPGDLQSPAQLMPGD